MSQMVAEAHDLVLAVTDRFIVHQTSQVQNQKYDTNHFSKVRGEMDETEQIVKAFAETQKKSDEEPYFQCVKVAQVKPPRASVTSLNTTANTTASFQTAVTSGQIASKLTTEVLLSESTAPELSEQQFTQALALMPDLQPIERLKVCVKYWKGDPKVYLKEAYLVPEKLKEMIVADMQLLPVALELGITREQLAAIDISIS